MKDIRLYEAMAKLDLSDGERALLAGRAGVLEESFALLAAADTGGAEPLVTPLPLRNVLREDEAVQTVSRDEILSGAPERCDGYFQVPKTLE